MLPMNHWPYTFELLITASTALASENVHVFLRGKREKSPLSGAYFNIISVVMTLASSLKIF